MMNKISLLWMLGILCLPITNYAEIQVERAKHCGNRQQACCQVGVPGPMGLPGDPGSQGLPGAIRPLAYGDFYLTVPPLSLTVTIGVGDAILAQTPPFLLPQTRIATGVDFDPATGSVTVAQSGVYDISYTVNVVTLTPGLAPEEVFAPFQLPGEATIALLVNNTTLADGSIRSVQTISSGSPYIQIHGQVKLSLSAGDSITLINAGDFTLPVSNSALDLIDLTIATLQIQSIQPL